MFISELMLYQLTFIIHYYLCGKTSLITAIIFSIRFGNKSTLTSSEKRVKMDMLNSSP